MIHIVKNKDGSDTRLLVRKINKGDYNKKYLDLLKQLTSIFPDKISVSDFNNLVDRLGENHYIMVIEDIDTKMIIGCATLLIEEKFIHNMGKVGHIEDVVIDKAYRGLNLGKLIIDVLMSIGKKNGCYKIILDCEEKNIEFYERCGFTKKGVEMVKYFSPSSKF